jgi:hypothetical protein
MSHCRPDQAIAMLLIDTDERSTNVQVPRYHPCSQPRRDRCGPCRRPDRVGQRRPRRTGQRRLHEEFDRQLKLSQEDGRIEVEFEVDQNRNGVPWKVTLRRNGSVVAATTAITRAPSGSFIRRVMQAWAEESPPLRPALPASAARLWRNRRDSLQLLGRTVGGRRPSVTLSSESVVRHR